MTKVGEDSKKAVTPYGIKELLNGHNDLFMDIKSRAMSKILVGEDPGQLKSVEVNTWTYRWDGQTVCQPKDPRLYTDTLGYVACWAHTNAYGCESSFSLMLARDPCLP